MTREHPDMTANILLLEEKREEWLRLNPQRALFANPGPPWWENLQHALRQRGFSIHKYAKFDTIHDPNSTWLLVASSSASFPDFLLELPQRVVPASGLRSLVSSKRALCSTLSTGRGKVETLRESPIAPLCLGMPEDSQRLQHLLDVYSLQHRWIWLPSTVPGQRKQVFTTKDLYGIFQSNGGEWRAGGVLREMMEGGLRVRGSLASLHLLLLVTSFFPLRFFLAPRASLVYFRFDHRRSFNEIPEEEKWSLDDFLLWVRDQRGSKDADLAKQSIEICLVRFLLLLEHLIRTECPQSKRCTECEWDLLTVEMGFNSSLYPFIMDVNLRPSLLDLDDVTRKDLFSEMLDILIPESDSSVATEVDRALSSTSLDVGVMGEGNCGPGHDICLSHDELEILLQYRRESKQSLTSFRLVYPSVDESRHTDFIQELNGAFDHPRPERVLKLHDLYARVHRFFHGFRSRWEKKNEHQLEETTACSNDEGSLGTLRGIELVPGDYTLALQPEFHPLTRNYSAHVPYKHHVVGVKALEAHCNTEARVNHVVGPSGLVNVTVGIGETRVTIYVVDLSSRDSMKAVNKYEIWLKRQARSPAKNRPLPTPSSYEAFAIIQDCDMIFSGNDPCGLFPLGLPWDEFLNQSSQLPICPSAHVSGRWVVPCRCEIQDIPCETCRWDEAVWQPHNCRFKYFQPGDLQRCFAGRKLLFLGDSTTRGILYRLIERVNGSLGFGDKVHGMAVLPPWNGDGGTARAGFFYFPQFWLPSNRRPTFDESLFQLIIKLSPLRNDSSTVIVIGGYGFLASTHIHMISRVLRREGLEGSRVVIKTIGAGLRDSCNSLEEVCRLGVQNNALKALALAKGFRVLDTFNITMARFRDFYPGSCACHFHKTEASGGSGLGLFTVTGPVNAAYTDILLQDLCSAATIDAGRDRER
ncbi:unnamed protein product [Darwinula stevensoni]|uniref:Cadherin-like beta-sandwich-like domain-containing protein n=1 Tax=Darwinula stevensoni TaxID=69355 RepID=A0A7R8XES6_9CRUS|nr:unnamed protein product [Darwinula stevensoni]CAG0889964.1 unnamed protein product [Darwinula stevensoni]